MYPELFARFRKIAPKKDGVCEAVKRKEEYRTFSVPEDEAAEMLHSVADIVDDEDEYYKAALEARINPAAEDRVVAIEDSEKVQEEGPVVGGGSEEIQEEAHGALEGSLGTEHGRRRRVLIVYPSVRVAAHC